MRRHRHHLDAAFDAALAGRDPAGDDDVFVPFVDAVRGSLRDERTPQPSVHLAAVLREGPAAAGEPLPDDPDAPRTAPVPATDGRGGREVAAARLAAFGTAAKVGLVAAVTLVATTGAGVAGALPGPAQDAFDRVSSFVSGHGLPDQAGVPEGVGIPDDVTPDDVGQPDETGAPEDVGPPADHEPGPVHDSVLRALTGDDSTTPADGWQFGDMVSGRAQDQEDGSFGQEVAEAARENRPEHAGDDGSTPEDDGEAGLQRAPEDPPSDAPRSGQAPEEAGPDTVGTADDAAAGAGQDIADDRRPEDPPAGAGSSTGRP